MRKDSPITEVKELDGLVVAFPAPASFAATVLPLAALRSKNITVRPKYVNSHDSVYLTVARGLCPAGGGVMSTFNSAPDEVGKELRVLWKTERYTSHAFAARRGLAAGVVVKVLKAMQEMGSDAQAKSTLDNLDFSGFEKAKDQDWDDVRALRIEGTLQPLLQETR